MKNKIGKIAALTLAVLLGVTAVGCNKEKEEKLPVYDRVADTRTVDDFTYTVDSIAATDALNRNFESADSRRSDKYVGLFYFLWLGQHQGSGQNGIYNITDLLENDPDALWDISAGNKKSPTNAYHFWGEPLYGYYNSADEWVIRKHMELFTYAGIDFLCFDTTNAYTYSDVALKVMSVLDDYSRQGWKVPQVMFYTNTASVPTMESIYREIYIAHPEYENLWFAPNGKPMIVGAKSDLIASYDSSLNPIYKEQYKYLLNFFELKDSQWPTESRNKDDGFPWIEFDYPQYNHGGVMSVSVAQHTTVRMSNMDDGNWGRGYNRDIFLNEDKRGREGLNYQSQWDTVFDERDDVDIAFITGWNEWIALKLTDKSTRAFFVDTFNENYSRDLEMMKGGYGDNFYLQTIANLKKYKATQAKHYTYEEKTPASVNDEIWDGVRAFRDFVGDCRDRNSEGFYRNSYTDNSGRNDIASVRVAHDKTNLYVKITCAENITEHTAGDTNWMNLYIGTDSKRGYKYGDYQFVINKAPSGKTTSVERFTAFGKTKSAGSAAIEVEGKSMMLTIPLSALGLNENNCHIRFKVADNIEADENFENFYTKGDCAPIGRLSYTYGY